MRRVEAGKRDRKRMTERGRKRGKEEGREWERGRGEVGRERGREVLKQNLCGRYFFSISHTTPYSPVYFSIDQSSFHLNQAILDPCFINVCKSNKTGIKS